MLKLKKLNNESGLISIVATLVIMSLLTLIALGFANLANREQRQALDQQLNTQAFYAAESGINDVIHGGSGGCTNPVPLGSDPSVSASCVLVNDQLERLDYSSVNDGKSIVVPIQPAGPNPLTELIISWEGVTGGVPINNASCGHNILTASDWGNNHPLLRVMLMPSSGGRATIIDKMQTLLLYPSSDTSCSDTYSVPLPDNYTTKGNFVDGHCDAAGGGTYKCTSKISNLNIAPTDKFYLRLRPVYKAAKINIMGKDASNNLVKFVGAQREIDSTGRTSDVLRRLVVHVPLTDNISDINYATETTNSLCKRLFVSDTGVESDVQINNPAGADSNEVATCDPANW